MDGQLVQDFKNYSNSFGIGFLKEWKANSILWALKRMPQIMDDEVRFLSYLKNCLEMEAFRAIDIELIMGWLYERKDEL
jgi:hypothetical protein